MNPKLLCTLSVLAVLLVVLYLSQKRIMYEGFEGGADKSLVICKADWCGHCKKAAPEFQKLVAASPMTLKDGSKIVVKVLDADKDKTEISKYKVRGYPTILVDNNGQTTEYPGERTADAVIDFLNSNY
jgi:thiol-disulfide isomerase/thioredoxin